jgi:hypothetical protein
MVGSYAAAIINDATQAQYIALYFGSDTVSTNIAVPVPVAGTISNMYINVASNASTTNCTVTLNVNNIDTALAVTITALTTGTFSDTSNSVNVNAGDLICFHANQATTGDTAGMISCKFLS